MRTSRHGEAHWCIAEDSSCERVKQSKLIPVLKEETRYGKEWRIVAMRP